MKTQDYEHQSLTVYSSLMTQLKSGLFQGCLSQHCFISFSHPSGTFFGIGGLRSLSTTYSETTWPLIFLQGGSREAISHIMMPKLNTSALMVYACPLITSGAIHWQVPILLVMQLPRARVHPKSPILTFKFQSIRMLRLLRSRCRMGGWQRCRQSIARLIYRAILRLSYQVRIRSGFWRMAHRLPLEQYSKTIERLGGFVQAWLQRHAQEQHDIGMSDRLHRVTLRQEIPDSCLINRLKFELLNRYDCLPPPSFIYDPIPTFANLPLNQQFFPVDLQIAGEDSMPIQAKVDT